MYKESIGKVISIHYTYDEKVGYTLRPNIKDALRSINTDSKANRVVKYPFDPNKRTVAFIGDSTVFGYLVKDGESFPYLLSEKNPKLNIVNMGVPAYGVENIEATLEYKLEELKPEVVFVSILWPFYDPKKYNFIEHKKLLKKRIPNRYSGIIIDKLDPFSDTVGYIDKPMEIQNNIHESGLTMIQLNLKIPKDGVVKHASVYIPSIQFKKAIFKLKIFREYKNEEWGEIGSSGLFNLKPGANDLILENEINVKEGDVIGFFASGTTPAINTLEGWAKTYYQPGDISKLSLQKMKKNPATEKYAITVKVQHAKFKKFI